MVYSYLRILNLFFVLIVDMCSGDMMQSVCTVAGTVALIQINSLFHTRA